MSLVKFPSMRSRPAAYNGLPYKPTLFVHTDTTREILTVGSGRGFATLALAIAYIADGGFASANEHVGAITTTAGSATVTGSGFLNVNANDYLYCNGYWMPVKSVESDASLTLWAGAQASFTATATRFVLQRYTIELFDNYTMETATLPDGADILIVGHTSDVVISMHASRALINTTTEAVAVEVTHCIAFVPADSGGSGLIFGGQGVSRGIFNIHDIYCKSDVPGGALFANLFGAAVTLERINGLDARLNIGGDYMHISGNTISTYSTSDHFLFAQGFTTDAGHPLTVSNCTSISHGAVIGGQSAGLEFNALPAGKVVNVSDSVLIADTATTPVGSFNAQVLWTTATAGAITNVTNCIMDNRNQTSDIISRGSTLNLDNVKRTDGTDCRVVTL